MVESRASVWSKKRESGTLSVQDGGSHSRET